MSAAEQYVQHADEILTHSDVGLLKKAVLMWVEGVRAFRPEDASERLDRLSILYGKLVRLEEVPPKPMSEPTPKPPPVRLARVLSIQPAPLKPRRRGSDAVDAVVKAYLALCEQPFRKGQLTELAAAHGYKNIHNLMMTLRHRGVWRRRYGGGK